MCGISGWTDLRDSLEEYEDVIKAMGDAIGHRGPDAKGDFCDRGCRLAHRRLSVIDPENGSQPMTYGNIRQFITESCITPPSCGIG